MGSQVTHNPKYASKCYAYAKQTKCDLDTQTLIQIYCNVMHVVNDALL